MSNGDMRHFQIMIAAITGITGHCSCESCSKRRITCITSITLPKLTGSSELRYIVDPKAAITAIADLFLD